ncbi:MAG: hypothetical protein MJZ93_00785 [Paludibacteraceae bacterium]|nr:hypothetical protein [Paludibacteraceae bacterium]
MSLSEQLNNFKRNLTEKELTVEFKKLAETFLYGGYINVNGHYHIYIRTVEFYYHEENGNIKDPIVYHRNNNRDVDGKVPYFPPMMLHAHNSGYDITFEDEANQVRSSALIRGYEIYDVKEKHLWCWEIDSETKRGHFVARKPDEVNISKKVFNTQCTYLKVFLNGFMMNGNSVVTWEDVPSLKNIDISQKTRQGVFKYTNNDIRYKDGKNKCERLWAFMRKEDLKYK